jgi:tetratricopeptide (TPR) repeat protein
LKEYRHAEQLDDTSADAHRDVGKMLLAKKDVSGALQELKYAANLIPNDFEVHEVYGQALAASGDLTGAIAEFKQALVIDSRHAQVKLELASAFERNGDWANAIDQYRQAALTDKSADVQDKYTKAQDRVRQHIASMKGSGESAEAKTLKKDLQVTKTEPAISEKLDADMEAGFAALVANHPNEGEVKYKEAVDLAEKLQPRDYRLSTSLIRLAGIYAAKNEFPKAETALQLALAENVKLYGKDSPLTTEPLQALGSYSLFRKNYNSALDFTLRAVDVNIKAYGEDSDKVADALRLVANVYVAQSAYDKAEPYLLRAVRIDSPFMEHDKSGMDSLPAWSLCQLYDKWNKPEKAEPLYRRMLAILEKQYGSENPFLLSALTGEAKTLHQLGRSEEAAKVEERMKSIQAATGQTEGAGITPQR